jgi:hypothetical protein
MNKPTKRKKKKSLMPGMIQAIEEIRADLLGIKKLPDATHRIEEIARRVYGRQKGA